MLNTQSASEEDLPRFAQNSHALLPRFTEIFTRLVRHHADASRLAQCAIKHIDEEWVLALCFDAENRFVESFQISFGCRCPVQLTDNERVQVRAQIFIAAQHAHAVS